MSFMENINLPRRISLLLAEETGWHIGDGSMNYYQNKGKLRGLYSLRGHIKDDRLHYIQRIKPIFDKLYGTNLSLRDMPSTGVYGFQFWSSKLVDFKRKLGLPLGKKLYVEIPLLFTKKIETKIAILRGIFDTDGCVYLEKKNNKLYPRMHIGTISKNLARDLFLNFRDLGFRTTCHYEPPSENQKRKGKFYVISIRGEKMFYKFMKIIDPQNPKHIKKYRAYKIFCLNRLTNVK